MKAILYAAISIFMTANAQAALPGDAAQGKRLHEANCTSCHNTNVYTRKNRMIHSLDALQEQLQGCGHMAKKQLSTAEAQNLIKYLNDQFYQFQ